MPKKKRIAKSKTPGMGAKTKMLLLHPGKFFESVRSEDFKQSLPVFLLLFFITYTFSPHFLVIDFHQLTNAFAGLAWIFVFIAITHFLVRVLGSKENIYQTLKIFMYSLSAVLFVSMILGLLSRSYVVSVLYVILILWGIYLAAAGISKIHKISKLRIAAVVVINFAVLLLAIALTYFIRSGSLPRLY